jgi:hypothetical protein
VGLLLSMIFRRRWLSLTGLGLCLAGVLLGDTFRIGWLAPASILVGGGLMLAQIPLGVRHDLRTMKGVGPEQKP